MGAGFNSLYRGSLYRDLSVLGDGLELCNLLGPDSMCCCMIAWSVYYKESNLPEILGKKKIQVSVNAILMQFQKMNEDDGILLTWTM